MAFVAQVDLANLPKAEEFGWLPASGVLFYFVGIRWGELVEKASVLYAEQGSSEQRAAPADTTIATPQFLSFEVKDTYRPLTNADGARQFEDDNEIWSWHHALMPFHRHWQIGGWPKPLQSRDDLQPAELLGQFDVDRLFAGIGGYTRGFFWVKPEEAKQDRFDQTVLLGEAD